MAWVYTLTLALALGVLMLLTREHKHKQVEIAKTREQLAVERMHAARAAGRRRGKHGKKR